MTVGSIEQEAGRGCEGLKPKEVVLCNVILPHKDGKLSKEHMEKFKKGYMHIRVIIGFWFEDGEVKKLDDDEYGWMFGVAVGIPKKRKLSK